MVSTAPTFPQLSSRWEEVRTDARMLAVDALIVVGSYTAAMLLRFDGRVPAAEWSRFVPVVVAAVVVYLGAHAALGLYGRVWRQAGPAEAWSLLVASAASTTVVIGIALSALPLHLVPLSVPFNGGALGLLLFGGIRFHQRIRTGHTRRGPAVASRTRVLLVGPVECVRSVLAQIRSEPEAGLLPVAILTQDRAAWHRNLGGLVVEGPLGLLAQVAEQSQAEQVLLVPGSPEDDLILVADLAREVGVAVRILPSLQERPCEPPSLRSIRDLSIDDLLGREPVDMDDRSVLEIVRGRRVLVTGAGGSIGREIALQLSQLEPATLLLLDHDETHLHEVTALLGGRPSRPVLGDIRDEAFVRRVFSQEQPEVVFHAAAHKHVPILEAFPSEAVKTNVHGTDVLIRAALRQGTQRFVAISTDKAVEPTSVMGASKRLAEQLLLLHRCQGMHYCAVRFGNVLGSRGSVVPTFVRQVEQGGPVTVTHPEMTRFFMTTREAVHLVLQAATRCEGGEVFMLDMGRPVRIVELAQRIIALAGDTPGETVSIEYTGLRPGERLTEQLYSTTESVVGTSHPKIMLVRGGEVPGELLRRGVRELVTLAEHQEEEGTRRLLFELAAEHRTIRLDGSSSDILARRETTGSNHASVPAGRR